MSSDSDMTFDEPVQISEEENEQLQLCDTQLLLCIQVLQLGNIDTTTKIHWMGVLLNYDSIDCLYMAFHSFFVFY